ncbi:hypothetical protein DDB_G0284081 [Dictyostelium discoideum AX4]|uniref:Uncharacterized protein n=1 Tax=Dictyostelium discoideum TaxID=44689 RepID=Q54Q59_DICDI|nr:hypothetical protein DDB_G0284081 [Dictyostelium discoideum AX4]EAL65381.1 hypothetical protein DDB_G0284081 [Dictyostelium discoideum AX4]|eukprot:XP_638738.1 hypothetical protein DDB_G0284081 [Dictyostelium discoideum AX4]
MECIDSLALAINSFPGGMILVSHDFRLISQVAKEIWVCDNKTITKWPLEITSYNNYFKVQMRDLTKQSSLASLKK